MRLYGASVGLNTREYVSEWIRSKVKLVQVLCPGMTLLQSAVMVVALAAPLSRFLRGTQEH